MVFHARSKMTLCSNLSYPKNICFLMRKKGDCSTWVSREQRKRCLYLRIEVQSRLSSLKLKIVKMLPLLARKGFINKNLKSSHYCSNLTCNYKPLTCPKCGPGFLYQDPVNVSSYVCSRCTFTARICPKCNEGYLVIREKYGRFWGCSNYAPKGCSFTEPIY